jgi:hypothetical protein
MGQLDQILNAADNDLDLIVLVGARCSAQADRAGTGYDRIGIIPFTAGAELRLAKAGKVLARIYGRDLLVHAVDKIVERNGDDHQRRRILERVWNLNDEKMARAS